MKTKQRNGVHLRDFLAQELQDPDVKRHYDEARARATVQAAREVVEARRAAGMTQAELARRIGSDQKGIWRLEAGRQNATVGILEKVAKATGGTLEIKITRRKVIRAKRRNTAKA